MNRRHKEQAKQLIIVGEEPAAKPIAVVEPVKATISFDQWWLQVQNSKNLRPELKAAIYKHFESRGFLADGNFDAGLKDFGVKA